MSVSFDQAWLNLIAVLGELVDIYVVPSADIVPALERKIVFNGLQSMLAFHEKSFLPALEAAGAGVLDHRKHIAEVSTAHEVAKVFSDHAAFFKMYSGYVK